MTCHSEIRTYNSKLRHCILAEIFDLEIFIIMKKFWFQCNRVWSVCMSASLTVHFAVCLFPNKNNCNFPNLLKFLKIASVYNAYKVGKLK